MAFGASAANAGITIPAGDWTIDIGGNVNAYYIHHDQDSVDENTNNVNTGLLPAALGIGGKTRQNDLDIAFQFTFFTGIDSTTAYDEGGYGANSALGINSLNIRQAYMTFGDASWGSIKMGRDLGIFGSDAILSDMTLLGVGAGGGGTGNTTLGRIGFGYMYADWVTQISYTSPNWNGFSFAAGARTPWASNNVNDSNTQEELGFEGKVQYEWAGDVSGKVWAGFITQDVNLDDDSYRANGWELGGKASVAGFEAVASYSDGDGMGRTGFLLGGYDAVSRDKLDSDNWYVQGTYTIPGINTKIGLSYGESNIDAAGGGENTNEAWMLGVYHPLTKSLNLVAEYIDGSIDNAGLPSDDFDTIALGAILFF